MKVFVLVVHIGVHGVRKNLLLVDIAFAIALDQVARIGGGQIAAERVGAIQHPDRLAVLGRRLEHVEQGGDEGVDPAPQVA